MHIVDLSKTLATWQAAGVAVRGGQSPSSVVETFRSLGWKPTPDVIELYTQVGGFDELDHEGWCLWTLDRVTTDNAEKSAVGVYFADYLINCWQYLLVPRGDHSAVFRENFDGNPPYQVAPSVGEFFRRYGADASSVLRA